ncbi:hypothetical protein Aab01nite_62740 [Paractinoplanes abujensis]|uniref:Uncharacterized protein n=1 Tax=Paractinoplanes abujensis TaxID=882441 RepID=A0A7W7CQE8_9ACTN|nr:hypothetical protein [Actinoplanes abujensis]MBB4692817.1 hypothetical protein [Actinoplanes abujensis]GID22684.1 hypothetical protein Aab01nite_62740 [Actinoplanes abujensis]
MTEHLSDEPSPGAATGTWSGSNPGPGGVTFNGTTCAGGTAPAPCTMLVPGPLTDTIAVPARVVVAIDKFSGPSTPPATAPVKVWMAGHFEAAGAQRIAGLVAPALREQPSAWPRT